MPCSRGITFPIRQLIESIFATPPLSELDPSPLVSPVTFEAGKTPISKETEGLLHTLVDRFEEQLLVCGVRDVGDSKSVHIRGIPHNVESVVWKDRPHDRRIRNAVDHEFEMINWLGDSFHLALTLADDGGKFVLIFQVTRETNSIWVSDIIAENLQNVLGHFDPMGTGYEFFTPTQALRFKSEHWKRRFGSHVLPEGITLTSPELRQYMSRQNLLSSLIRDFENKNYNVDRTRAYEALKPTLRRHDDDDQEGDSKRRRLKWEIGAMGYHLN
tara:strand:+ start:7772 stop:8587 length:816 start_codon:yes stop_codon:yes gene_type:complete